MTGTTSRTRQTRTVSDIQNKCTLFVKMCNRQQLIWNSKKHQVNKIQITKKMKFLAKIIVGKKMMLWIITVVRMLAHKTRIPHFRVCSMKIFILSFLSLYATSVLYYRLNRWRPNAFSAGINQTLNSVLYSRLILKNKNIFMTRISYKSFKMLTHNLCQHTTIRFTLKPIMLNLYFFE